MTTATAQASRINAKAARTGFTQVLMFEWTKFASLRSNFWILAAASAVTIGIGAVFVFAHLDLWSAMSSAERATVDPIQESFIGLWFAGLLGFAVIGALTMTAEYSAGTITSTFAAVPRRVHVLGAKTLLVGIMTFVVGTATAFTAYFVGQPLLARESLDVSLSDSGIVFAVLGGGIYATGAALIGLVLGAILRRTAATLVAVTVAFPLATLLALAQPASWSAVTQYLPHAAGMALISSIDHSDLLSPVAGLIVLSAWVAAGIIVSAVLLERRDAEA
jgi:ABC-2 type transport system permease protein